jgi:hypothetical protein
MQLAAARAIERYARRPAAPRYQPATIIDPVRVCVCVGVRL